jgi:uncharacterized protein (DUF1800 family)
MKKMNRRAFVTEAAKAITTGNTPPQIAYNDPSNKSIPRHLAKTSTGLNPYTGVWTDAQVKHLLNRTLFGCTFADIDFFKLKTMSEAVDFILNVPLTQPAPPVNNYSTTPEKADAEIPYGSTWVTADANLALEGDRIFSFKLWTIGQFINQERNIREKMTLFWHNHFATETFVIEDARYVYKHHALLRENCLGNFKQLVKDVTIDPAMLRYLNGFANTKNAPDENYARELQELFTIGKDLQARYTENDVKQAARVLTGWRDNRTSIGSNFNANQHDTGNKQFSAFYNNTIITGKTGAAGATETDELIDMIFANEEVSKYICRKIYRYFIYYIIDEQVETNIITPLAQIFRTNNYNIKPVLETLFKSEHFFDTLNMGCYIKQPFDHLIGFCKQTHLTFPAPTADTEQIYNHWAIPYYFATLAQQDYGEPPNVAGWPAFYQSPQYYEMWINSDSLPKRNTFCDIMIYVGYNKNNFVTMLDPIAFAQRTSNPANPNTLINDWIKLLYTVEVSQLNKDTMKLSFLLSGQSADHYWTDAWNQYIANPNDVMAKAAVTQRLQALLKYIVGQAEYQLC